MCIWYTLVTVTTDVAWIANYWNYDLQITETLLHADSSLDDTNTKATLLS